MFNDVIENHLPEHPKNLYENARKIRRDVIIHIGPTNSGKTFEALEALKTKNNGIYLSPLRLLALEVFEKLNMERVECNLITGEEEIILKNATHTSCTVEKANLEKEYNIAVIDECQMISDPSRGAAWTRAVLGLCANELHLCCSSNALNLLLSILKDCNDNITIFEHKRDTPLLVEKKKFRFPNNIQRGDAFIVFSRASVLKVAAFLNNEGIKSSIIYGNLPPETRRKQVELFNEGKTDVIVATDAIGMGLNLPIRRIIFLENQKFDGQINRYLNSSEIKQISGRAGRKGIYDEGYVNSTHGKSLIENALEEPDEILEYAYIFPNEELILNYFQMGTLKERLLTWVNYKFEYPYFQKSDISDLIEHLTELDKKQETTKDILVKKYKLMLTPFNKRNEKVFSYWYKCAYDILDNKNKSLAKPTKLSDELSELENYYQMLAVYYYLCKTFRINFDKKWIETEREYTSDKIHEYLIKNIKNHIKKCTICGKNLAWNSFYSICEKCYEEKSTFSYSNYMD
jgi:ATP-dependent RNA helicase SUPV3L1/SUV3